MGSGSSSTSLFHDDELDEEVLLVPCKVECGIRQCASVGGSSVQLRRLIAQDRHPLGNEELNRVFL